MSFQERLRGAERLSPAPSLAASAITQPCQCPGHSERCLVFTSPRGPWRLFAVICVLGPDRPGRLGEAGVVLS